MASPTPRPVILSETEIVFLEQFVRTGVHRSREINRAHVLLKLHRGVGASLIAEQVEPIAAKQCLDKRRLCSIKELETEENVLSPRL